MSAAVTVGTMQWKRDRWRRWGGRRWANATYSVQPERLRSSVPFEREPELSAEARERILARAVDAEVLAGATVLHQAEGAVILGYPRRINHLGHFLLTLLTGGLWGFVWLVLALSRTQDRIRLDVDQWGNVWPVAAPR